MTRSPDNDTNRRGLRQVRRRSCVTCPNTASDVSRECLAGRQLRVLRLLIEGESNPEIAAALFISRKTVLNHVTNILAKLEVESRTAAATHVLRHEDV